METSIPTETNPGRPLRAGAESEPTVAETLSDRLEAENVRHPWGYRGRGPDHSDAHKQQLIEDVPVRHEQRSTRC